MTLRYHNTYRRESAMSLGSWNLVLLAFPGPFTQFFPKCRQVDVREGAGLKTGLKDDRAVRIGPVVMYAEDWPRLRRGLRVANLSDVKYPPPAVPGSKCRESNVCGKQTT